MKHVSIMKYWDKDYEEKVIHDGYEDLLRFTQLYLAQAMPSLAKEKMLPKSKQQNRQQKPCYRTSNIYEDTKSKIMMLHYNSLPPLSCRKIAAKLYKDYNISINYSTVSKIIKGTYKPKLKKR